MLFCQVAEDMRYVWPLERAWMRPEWGALWIYFIAVLCLQSLSWLAGVATVLNCTAVPQSVAVLITQMWAAARQFLTNEGACFPARVPYVWHVGPFPPNAPQAVQGPPDTSASWRRRISLKLPTQICLLRGKNTRAGLKDGERDGEL